jgi:hypothetical protein
MAIIVEEEKNRSNLASMLGWVIIAVIVIIAAYYLFIAQPETGPVTPPSSFNSIVSINQINFDPTTIVQSPEFQALKQYVSEPTSTGPATVGRTNPFLGY